LGAYRIPRRPAFSSHLVNSVIAHVGTGPDLSNLPKSYSDSAVAD
jgi:hypothetical protein